MARQIARKVIKEQLRRQRVKLGYAKAREIAAQAKAMAAHPEIIAEARAKAAELGYA